MRIYNNLKWQNHIQEHTITPAKTFYPQTIEDIILIIKEAEAKSGNVKACGSGHSWSEICPTYGFMIEPDDLSGELPLEGELLTSEVKDLHLVRVKSGTKISALNDLLDTKGLALPYLGGFDGQTIAGVCQTSTHGSAIGKGPLHEMVLSYDLVGSTGQVYRIEKSKGITNASMFLAKYPNVKLIQDDHYFNAVSTGIGCLGVIYAMVIEAVKSFYLEEKRFLSTWIIEKERLKEGLVFEKNYHFELMINPHPGKTGNHLCLTTTRNKIIPQPNLSHKDRSRNDLVEFIASFNKKGILNWIFNVFKKSSDELLDDAIKSLKDDRFINKSYKVFHIGEANYIPSYSAEIAFDMKNDKYIQSIDRILEVIENNKKSKNLYHSAPIAIRFVKASDSFLSPMHQQDTCMVEVILAKGTNGSKDILSSIEKEAYRLGGRMHWGQYNFLNQQAVTQSYPALQEWKKVASELNSTGVFNNPFSNSVGLST